MISLTGDHPAIRIPRGVGGGCGIRIFALPSSMRMVRGFKLPDQRQTVRSSPCFCPSSIAQRLYLSWWCFAVWRSRPARKARWSAVCSLASRYGIPTRRKRLGAFQRPPDKPAANMKPRRGGGAFKNRGIDGG